MTNGEKIRSMSNEELAEYINNNTPECTMFNQRIRLCDGETGADICYKCTLKWLEESELRCANERRNKC